MKGKKKVTSKIKAGIIRNNTKIASPNPELSDIPVASMQPLSYASFWIHVSLKERPQQLPGIELGT